MLNNLISSLMNISQHSFCPLGFLVNHYFDDNFNLVSDDKTSCSVLSPSCCHNIALFSLIHLNVIGGYFRFQLPFVKSRLTDVGISSVSKDFVLGEYSVSIAHNLFNFNVVFLNF